MMDDRRRMKIDSNGDIVGQAAAVCRDGGSFWGYGPRRLASDQTYSPPTYTLTVSRRLASTPSVSVTVRGRGRGRGPSRAYDGSKSGTAMARYDR
jgi:hypothetical protein